MGNSYRTWSCTFNIRVIGAEPKLPTMMDAKKAINGIRLRLSFAEAYTQWLTTYAPVAAKIGNDGMLWRPWNVLTYAALRCVAREQRPNLLLIGAGNNASSHRSVLGRRRR